MANSNNGALKHGQNEDHKRGEDVAADAVKAVPGRSSAKSSARSSARNSKEPRVNEVPRNPKEPRVNEVPRNSKEPRVNEVPRNPKPPAQQVPGRPRKQSRRGQGGGPKTKAGKAAVSRNAIKHGITSASPVIPGMESEEGWQAHLDGIVESVAPEGYLERELAGLFAHHLWQLRRVNRYITAVTAMHVASMEEDFINSAMYLYGVEAVKEQAEGGRCEAVLPRIGLVLLYPRNDEAALRRPLSPTEECRGATDWWLATCPRKSFLLSDIPVESPR